MSASTQRLGVVLAATAIIAAAAATAQTPAILQALAPDPNGKVATVNGKDIPQARATLLVRERTAQGQPDSPQLRTQVKDELINREIIIQEAERRGMLKNADVQQQIEVARQQVILRTFLQDWQKNNPIGDDQLKAEYEKIKASMSGNEFKASHILVEKEDEAKDIIAKLKKGGKFAELAKASKDPGSKDNGGDLGWNTAQTFVKPFADAMSKLKKGETTGEPVQTQFGYHVIRLEDTRSAQHPPFDEVKQQMQQRLHQQQLEKLVAELRAKAKIN